MIDAPVIGYALLLPFIVIFAAACLGVLVEAAVPRDLRRAVQLLLAFLAIGVALAVTLLNWSVDQDVVVGVGSVAVDGPTSFMWAILLVFSALSFGMFAERRLESGVSAFAPQAAAVPGTAAELEAIAARREHTEDQLLGRRVSAFIPSRSDATVIVACSLG